MKKVFVWMNTILLLFVLSGCQEKAEPLESPKVEDYEIFYEFDEYTMYKKKVIEDNIYLMYAFIISEGDESCTIGHYHEVNFMVFYDDEFYRVQEFNKKGMYDCDALQESGFLDEGFHNNENE